MQIKNIFFCSSSHILLPILFFFFRDGDVALLRKNWYIKQWNACNFHTYYISTKDQITYLFSIRIRLEKVIEIWGEGQIDINRCIHHFIIISFVILYIMKRWSVVIFLIYKMSKSRFEIMARRICPFFCMNCTQSKKNKVKGLLFTKN